GVAILLFFFNLMWTIYVFGAEVTKVYADYLAYGDIAAPSERSAPLAVGAEDGEAAARESDAPESPWRTGIIAFLIGLVTGWSARRRASERLDAGQRPARRDPIATRVRARLHPGGPGSHRSEAGVRDGSVRGVHHLRRRGPGGVLC